MSFILIQKILKLNSTVINPNFIELFVINDKYDRLCSIGHISLLTTLTVLRQCNHIIEVFYRDFEVNN